MRGLPFLPSCRAHGLHTGGLSSVLLASLIGICSQKMCPPPMIGVARARAQPSVDDFSWCTAAGCCGSGKLSGASVPADCALHACRRVQYAPVPAGRSLRVLLFRPIYASDERLRGGAEDPDDARLERMRRERFGEEFGKVAELESSAVYGSDGDSRSVGSQIEGATKLGVERLEDLQPAGTRRKRSLPSFDADRLFARLDMVPAYPLLGWPLCTAKWACTLTKSCLCNAQGRLGWGRNAKSPARRA